MWGSYSPKPNEWLTAQQAFRRCLEKSKPPVSLIMYILPR